MLMAICTQKTEKITKGDTVARRPNDNILLSKCLSSLFFVSLLFSICNS